MFYNSELFSHLPTKKNDKMSKIEFNKNDDKMRLLLSKMRRKHAEVSLGGGKNKIKQQHKIDNRDNLMKKMLANKYEDMMNEEDTPS